MKTVLATKSPAAFAPLPVFPTQWLNPFRVLRALERLNKFRALSDAALRDAGLTQADVARAKLSDFMAVPNS